MTAHDSGGPVFSGSATASFTATPRAVFDLVTDVRRLPEWNAAITKVLERPAILEPGAEWLVVVKPAGMPSWRSRSRLTAIDAVHGVFRHRSATDDGNPGYVEWNWQVVEEAAATRLTVEWTLHPRTFWRKRLFAPWRARVLRTREVPDSLTALRRALSTTHA
ncbi:SRPBCC family protein [Embleya sp. NPDC055664]